MNYSGRIDFAPKTLISPHAVTEIVLRPVLNLIEFAWRVKIKNILDNRQQILTRMRGKGEAERLKEIKSKKIAVLIVGDLREVDCEKSLAFTHRTQIAHLNHKEGNNCDDN